MLHETKLYHLLCQLFEFATNQTKTKEFEDELTEILEHNNFEHDAQAPQWLLNFLQSIISKESVATTSYDENQQGAGDIFNLLAELEDIIPVEWENEGELLTVTFHSGLVIGFIMFEGSAYAVRVRNEE